MNSSAELIAYCLSFNNVYKDYPFASKKDYCVIRHTSNKKIFALIFNKDNKTWVNLKCQPMTGDFLRQAYKSVVPAYHMNKEHWISVILDNTIPHQEIINFINTSYDLTKPKIKAKKQTTDF